MKKKTEKTNVGWFPLGPLIFKPILTMKTNLYHIWYKGESMINQTQQVIIVPAIIFLNKNARK
jgi:hypothetical protein